MTPEQVSTVAGILLALSFDYVPGLKDWYDKQGVIPKRQLMLALLVLATLGALVNQCRGDGACYGLNAETALWALVAAVVANQATHSLTKPRAGNPAS